MGSVKSDGGDEACSSSWSVFDAVRAWPPSPEALMAEIDSAIAHFEYAQSTSLLNKEEPQRLQYDARLADQAYKSGCAALSAGNLEDALRFLHTSLSLCPPDKTSAVKKLRSLISLVSSQQQMQGSTTSSHR